MYFQKRTVPAVIDGQEATKHGDTRNTPDTSLIPGIFSQFLKAHFYYGSMIIY